MFVSCGKPIEKKYEIQNESQDLNKIKNTLTNNDYKILKWQLFFLKSKNNVKNKTYIEILNEGQVRWNDTIKKREEIDRKRREQLEREKEDIKNRQIASICNIKWGVYYYKPNYLEVNPEISMENQKLAESVFKWNPKNNWIIFNKDGTCKVKDEEYGNTYTKRWSLNENGDVVLPTGWQYEKLNMLMSKVTFEIIDLNDEIFYATEIEKSTNITLRSEIRMKKIK